ncbi:MAG: tetratricopeptide repeat protein [Deinococcota bacterium]
MQTAARIQPNTEVDNAYKKTVGQICQVVEGMPLAIELAASWLNVLSVEEILQELSAGIELLEASTRDVPERHKSIRAVFEYSWRLLSASQQRSLTALSVFIGNFDREAAQHVTATLTRGLLELMSKSLIRRQSTGRFDLHPLIQQYAYAKLAETHQRLKDMLAKHSAYYLEFLSLQGDALQRGEHKVAMDAVELNLNNCQQAWQWAVEAQQFDNIIASSHILETYYSQRNKVQEGVAFFEQMVAQLDMSDASQQVPVGVILASQGWLQLRMGRHQLAEQISLKALELLRPHAYYRGIMKTLNTLGVIYDRQGEYDQARACLEEAIDLAVTQNKPRLKASYMQNLAGIEASLGRLNEAESLYVEALANSKQLKNHVHVISILNNLGIVYQKQHKYEKSNALYEEGLALAKDMNLQKSIAYILSNMALNYAFLNQFDEARKYDEQALVLAQADQNNFLEASILKHLAELDIKQT